MNHRPLAACAGTLLLGLLASAAHAQKLTLKVDAVANCFNASVGPNGDGAQHSAAFLHLAAGSYSVKQKSSSADLCGQTDGTCLQPSVSLTLNGLGQTMEPYVIKPSHKVSLNLPASVTALAYVMDTDCEDNTGLTTLEFVLVPPPALD